MSDLTPFEIARRKWASPQATATVTSATPALTSTPVTSATVGTSAQSAPVMSPNVPATSSTVQATLEEPVVFLAVTERVAVALERIAAALEHQQASSPAPAATVPHAPVAPAAPMTTAAPAAPVVSPEPVGTAASAVPIVTAAPTATEAVPSTSAGTALVPYFPMANQHGLSDSESEGEVPPGTRCGICHGPSIQITLLVPCGHYPYCFACVENAKKNAPNIPFRCPNCTTFVKQVLQLK